MNIHFNWQKFVGDPHYENKVEILRLPETAAGQILKKKLGMSPIVQSIQTRVDETDHLQFNQRQIVKQAF